MAQHTDPAAARVVDRLAVMADERLGEQGPLVSEFFRRYAAEADADDLVDTPMESVFGAAFAQWEMGRCRAPGQTLVEVRSPEAGRDRWSTEHSVVFLVTDDAPFLVDSVRMVLDRHGVGIHLMVHPILWVRRDDHGEVVSFPARGGTAEAWTQMQIDRCGPEVLSRLGRDIAAAVADVHLAVDDFPAMRARTTTLAETLEADAADSADDDVRHRGARFLHWLVRKHFVFLGAADYRRLGGSLELEPDSVLGLLRNPALVDPPAVDDAAPVSVARAERRSTVHRPARLTCVSVRRFDADGKVTGEHRLLGLFAAAAYRESVTAIPMVREDMTEVMRRAGVPAESHTGRSLRTVLETAPRDDLIEAPVDRLFHVAMGIVGLQERRIVRVFALPERNDRYVTVLVYLPRQRFTAEAVERVAADVRDAFEGEHEEHDTTVGTSALARIVVSVRRRAGTVAAPDLDDLADAIDRTTRTWTERLRREAVDRLGEREGVALVDHVEVPVAYTSVVEPRAALADLLQLSSVASAPGDDATLATALVPDPRDGTWRFRLARRGSEVTLSDVLPTLEHFGLTVVDERPFRFRVDDVVVWLYDIGVRLPAGVELDPGREEQIRVAFQRVSGRQADDDGLNRLVLVAGLSCRQVDVLRAYVRYLRQIGFPYAPPTIEDALARLPEVTRRLAALFDARFDPTRRDRAARVEALRAEISVLLDEVPSLDDDRIGRAVARLIDATLRTNAFRAGDDAGHPPVLSLKLDPSRIPDLPLPRMLYEVWVSSPRVEGIHLRGGPIARGGIRWSDRRDDFRTEVLGLAKAQMVKNAVIVPVGAKGGFVVKRLPADPAARQDEVVAAYRLFISGLLDVTDNLVGGAMVPPPDVVRSDGDDPYLVVAADKGTATFSDIANEISRSYGFWLGDAFASGGSTGYDHKAMGITARGAWESVRRHARSLGLDADRDPLTVVGIGDMSGDVFGNGLLCSKHLRLVAAFDHRHVFLDPEPDPALAYAERRRLFQLPRSSWDDYDRAAISPGGGVFPRTAKVVPLSPQVRERLGVDAEALSPTELIAAILRAPVDLLWNGGIGTYVKSSEQTNADVGDRANDAVRVDGGDLRCRMVGEGGNLGLTQRGRVEYALAGGLVNTDAIDNSAGVDASDHEVNIKILLDRVIADDGLDVGQRNELLASMTDEVAELVLADNRAQTLALAIARRQAFPMVDVHARYLELLEAEGWLDRRVEDLPDAEELAERQAAGRGLTPPELAVLLAYTKNADVAEVLPSDLPDDPALASMLAGYFPRPLRERYPDAIAAHPLRREIVATAVVNQMVNLQGISFDHRMTEETGLGVADITRAWVAARDMLDATGRWAAIDELDRAVPLASQIELFVEARRLCEGVTLWLLRQRRPPVDIEMNVASFRRPLAALEGTLGEVLTGAIAEQVDAVTAGRVAAGVPYELAQRSAIWRLLHTGPDLVELAHRYGRPVDVVAATYWGLFDQLDLFWLWDRVGALPRVDRWSTQARSSVRDDLLGALVELTDGVLAAGYPVEGWIAANLRAVDRMRGIFREIRRAGAYDLTALSVAVRQLRNLALAHGRPEARRPLR